MREIRVKTVQEQTGYVTVKTVLQFCSCGIVKTILPCIFNFHYFEWKLLYSQPTPVYLCISVKRLGVFMATLMPIPTLLWYCQFVKQVAIFFWVSCMWQLTTVSVCGYLLNRCDSWWFCGHRIGEPLYGSIASAIQKVCLFFLETKRSSICNRYLVASTKYQYPGFKYTFKYQ